MKKTFIYRSILLLVVITLVSSCSASPYPKNQYRMDEAMLLMLTARMNLIGEEALITGINSGTASLMKPILQTQQEQVNQLRLLADYYRYYAQKYGERDKAVQDALYRKASDLRDKADALELRLQRRERGGFFRRAGRVLGQVVCFVMERVGEKVETVVEENIRQTINSVVISPRTIIQGRINLGWNRLLGPLGGNAASIIRAELFPQLDRARARLLAEARRLPDTGNELTDSIITGGSPRSDRLPEQSADQQEIIDDSMFEIFSQPPDNVEIALGGPIPRLPYTVLGQYFSNEGVESSWYFIPQSIEKWVMSVMTDDKEKKILGNFSAIALYYYEDEDKLSVSEGQADIIGRIPSSQFTVQEDQNSQFITAPFEMTLTGSVHEPNTFQSSIYINNKLVPRYAQVLVYQDVDFDITVFGTFKLALHNDGISSLEMFVTDCENSKFFSPIEGAQLTDCAINLSWNNLPD